MKISVNKDQIIEGLQKAASIIPAKAGGAYLRSIWMSAQGSRLSIMATDANLEFTGSYPAVIEESGLVGVHGRAFVDLVRQLPDGELKMWVESESGTLQIRQGRRNYRLPVSSSEWFENFSEFPEGEPVAWCGDVLLEILDRVAFCIDDDDTNGAVACLYIRPRQDGDMDACGLNGHQFALTSINNPDLAARLADAGLLIQKKYLPDLKKWLGPDEIELNLTDKRIYLRRLDGAEMLSLPRSMHDYPDYNIFMSKLDDPGASKLTLPRKEAMDALSRLLIFNTDSDRCVFMDLSGAELTLSARGGDVGSARESLEVEYKGSLDRIAFPTRSMLDIFGHFSSDQLELTFTGQEGPCGIRGGQDGNYLVIIMPMKISDKSYYEEEES